MAVPRHGDPLFVPLNPSLDSPRRHHCGNCPPWDYQRQRPRRRFNFDPMGIIGYAKRVVMGEGKQDRGFFDTTSSTEGRRKTTRDKDETRTKEQYAEKMALQRPPVGRTVRLLESRAQQPNDRCSQNNLMDFDHLQQSLIAHQAQQTLITTPHQAHTAADFDRLRKEILSNCWALLYLQFSRASDIDPVLVVESTLTSASRPPQSKHSAPTDNQRQQDSGEKFTAVVANQGQPFIQGAAGTSHEQALELLLAATTEAVHANRHRFFFSANHRKTLNLERSGGVIDAGSVAGAALGREMMMRAKVS